MAAKKALRAAPPPREVDTRMLVIIGTAAFLAVFLILLIAGAEAIWTRSALVGWILGLVGLVIIELQSRARRRRAAPGAVPPI